MARLEVAQEVDDLGLDGLSSAEVGSSSTIEPGLQHDGPGDRDALPLAARELVRVAVRASGGSSPTSVSASSIRRLRSAGAPADGVDAEPFLDDLADGQPRRERAVGILEDDLHLRGGAAGARPREALELAAAGTDRPLAPEEAQEGEAERGLARAALADDADRPALADGDADAVHGLDVIHRAAEHAGLDREPDLDARRPS